MTNFILKGKVKIKSKTAAQWQEWQKTKTLDEGQLGFIKDKKVIVCGDNNETNVYLDENIELSSTGKYQLDDATGKISVKGMGQIPMFVTAPMYGYGYTSEQDGEVVYKRDASEYSVPEGIILLLYDNYEDFDVEVINPDDVRS